MSILSTDLLGRTHLISVSDARDLIVNFAAKKADIIDGDYEDSEPLLDAQSFNKTALLSVLNQTGCIGIRFYNGFDENNKVVLVATGIDSEGNDLNLGINDTSDQHTILQHGQLCPTYCPDISQINK